MASPRAHLILALLLTYLAMSHADLYGNPSPPNSKSPHSNPPPPAGPAPPPPFAVKGKQFPPEVTFCDENTTCFDQVVSCPQECPQFKPANPNEKACFIDCNSPTCEGVCKTRKPNCDGHGAACYDPRFVGGDGIMFYFHGKSNHHFALVSDSQLQINARFIGLRPSGRPRDFTWIQSLGILFGRHSFSLAAKRVATWDNDVDQLAIAYDGVPLQLDHGHLTTWTSPAGLHVERTARVNSITVTLPRVFQIMANVVPVTKEDDKVHKYRIPADDCFAHLEVQFKFFNLSDKVEGVLGQTYRPDFQNPVKRGVPMPVMSGEERYLTTSLLSTSCKYCIFLPEIPEVIEMSTATTTTATPSTMDCTSKIGNGLGTVCRR